jgi:hypothetical protein
MTAPDEGVLGFFEGVRAFALGLGVVWLLMDLLVATFRRLCVRLGAIAAVLAVTGALEAACSFGVGEFSEGTAVGALFSVAAAVVFVSAIRIVVKTSRDPGSYLGFMLRLLTFTTLLPMVAIVLVGVLPTLVFDAFGVDPGEILLAAPIISFLFGLVLSFAAVPFAALSFMNESFLARFTACFELGIADAASMGPDERALLKPKRKLGSMM